MLVKGTELPDNVSKIQSISIALSTCTPVPTDAETGALSGTEIMCFLDRAPVCGDWAPEVTTFLGNVPIQEGLTPSRVECTIASVFPEVFTEVPEDDFSPLNLLGNDNLTFTGTNFPHELAGSTFDLTFSSNDQAKCTVVDSSSTELVCLT